MSFPLLPSPGLGAPGLAVPAAASNNGGSGTTVTVTISISNNHTAVITCRQGSSSTLTATISDSSAGSNTWTQSASGYSVNTGARSSGMWYSYLSASITSVTCTWSASTSNVEATVFDIVGTASSSIEDSSVNAANASAGSTFTSGSLTTTNARDILLFGVGCGGGNLVAGSGFTLPSGGQITGGNARSGMQYEIVSATQSGLTTTMTSSNSSTAYTSVFLALKGK